MHKRTQKINRSYGRGFTIVELLIVIVIIGILAAITIVAYNGIQTRARNVSRASEATQVAKLLASYKAQNGNFPTLGSGQVSCIGSGFPDLNSDGLADCWDVRIIGGATFHPDATFNTQLAQMGTTPIGDRTIVEYPFDGNGFVGPAYVAPGGPGTTGSAAYVRFFQEGTTCPSGNRVAWTGNGGKPVACAVDLQ
ncbi:MAG: prepilin-type N-terminal cleavage/methylation domain-containing protein [Candidatus Saccharimonadales bacterium]